MLIFILAIIVIILFVIGISLLYKGSAPVADPKELEMMKSDLSSIQSSREKLKAELDTAQKDSAKNKQALEEAQKSLTEAQKGLEETAALKANESKYQQQIRDLDEQLTRIYLKADEQAKEALDLINALRKDNETLKGQVAAQAAVVAPAADQEALKSENEALKKQLEEIQLKVTQLQIDLSAATEVKEKESEGAAELERLRTENQKFQETNAQLAEQVKTLTAQLQNNPQEAAELGNLKQALEQLKSENQTLQKQITDDKTAPASAEAVAQAQELQAACDDFKKQLDDMRQTVATLREQNAVQEKRSAAVPADIEVRLAKLKEVNDFLVKKEKFLQVELTKSRIKAVGLEKICEALKAQLESLTKATPAG